MSDLEPSDASLSYDIITMDNSEKEEYLDELLTENKLHHNEGERGISNLNNLCFMIGYDKDGFKYGSAFERFIQDNPGCIDAIHMWMAHNFTQEQFDLLRTSDD